MIKQKLTDKMKDGVSAQQLEDFAKKHTQEVFSTLAIFVGAVSSIFNFFTGAELAIFFASVCAIIGILFPVIVETKLKQIYGFAIKQEKTTEMILGGVKIVIAIFLPFIYFGFLGLLGGTSYHYYIRHARIVEENTSPKTHSRSRKTSDHS